MGAAIAEDGSRADDNDFTKLPDVSDPRVVQMVQHRLDGLTWEEIAIQLRVTPRTLWNWRQAHQLDEIVEQLSADAFESIRRKHLSNVRKTAARIGEMLDQASPMEDRKWAIDRVLATAGAAVQPGGAQQGGTSKAKAASTADLIAHARELRRIGKGGQ